MNTPKLIAAIDMGSSSFRMVVARVEELNQHCQIYMIDSLREPVRLGAGLDKNNNITPESQERALLALKRFGERLRHFEIPQVRAVATNALRIAKNSASFIAQAQAALGFPIEVIEGVEEARLVYCGVAHQLALGMGKRLVVDIGGGSTEFIVGEDYQTISMDSLDVGCISIAQRWFADGQITAKAMKNAILQARQEIATLHHSLDEAHWTHAVGSSGTSRALAEICTSNGFTTHGISAKGLEKIKQHVIDAGHLDAITLNGLKNDRLPMMPGGLAVMCAVFEELNIQHMTVTEGGLRQGVLYDLIGKHHHADMREVTVSQMAKRYRVDLMHAQQVQQLGLSLFDQLSFNAPVFESQRPLLSWACLLHEVGLCLTHNSHQKHAAYLLKNADMPGFSQQEQHLLAHWVLNHTGKLSKTLRWKASTPTDWAAPLCLRLSALFLRRRQAEAVPQLRVALQPQGLLLQVPQKYLDNHPLTQFSLEEEVLQWEKTGLKLKISTEF